MLFSRDGLTLTVHAPNQRVADNLERLFLFWPDDDPRETSKERLREIEAAIQRVKDSGAMHNDALRR